MAFLIILERAIEGTLKVVGSFVLDYENSRNPFDERRYMIQDLFSVSTEHVGYSKEVEERASNIEKMGIPAMDALHIACAESAGSDFFVTCDDILIRKVRPIHGKFRTKIVNLLDFVSKEVL
jgi:predicted nucleic acid-binding protein